MTKLPRIKAIRVIPPYGLCVTWRDGREETVDMEGIVFGFEPFAPLRDTDVFAQARLMEWGDGVEWPGGLDYSADSLAFLAEQQREMTPGDLKAWQKSMRLSNREAADWMQVGLSTWKTYTGSGARIPRSVQIAARATARNPGLFQAYYKPRRPGRPRAMAHEDDAG